MTTNLTAAVPTAPQIAASTTAIYNGGLQYGAATTVAVILGIILIINIWKKGSPRFNGWLGLFVGLTGASIFLSWIGNFATLQVFGVGIMSIIALGGLFLLWHELIKKRGLHRLRTPAVALLTGVAVMTMTGVIGTAAHGTSNVITTGVTRVSNSGTGG